MSTFAPTTAPTTTGVAAGAVNAGIPNINQHFRENVTLGIPVVRPQELLGDGLEGKMMGLGTYANQGKYFFTTKESSMLVPEFAASLNEALAEQIRIVNSNQFGTDYHAGLYGYVEGESAPRFYNPNIQRFYPDDRARVTVSNLRTGTGDLDDRVPRNVVPGSSLAKEINRSGIAAGLAYVKSAANRTGYVRPGSKGWINQISRVPAGTFKGNPLDYENMFGQGAVYGLGPVYQMFGVDVIPVADEREQGGIAGRQISPDDTRTFAYPVRFLLPNGTDDLNKWGQDNVLMRFIRTYYNDNLKNPDQVRLGQYGAANLMLRHADKMTLGESGSQGSFDNIEGFNNAIVDAFQNNGSVKGVARWGRDANGVDYTSIDNRYGITANPLRSADGIAVGKEQSKIRNSGFCNLYGSGPGIGQGASLGHEYGFRFTKQSRPHISTANGSNGVEIREPTYFCGRTPDYVVNPDRKVYQAGVNGGERAMRDMNLEQVLQAVGAATGLQGFNADDLRAKYYDFTENMQNYGVQEYFGLDPNTGRRGVSVAAPNYWKQEMTPEQALQFQRYDLSSAKKSARSKDIANEQRTGARLQTNPTSYPTSSLNSASIQSRGA